MTQKFYYDKKYLKQSLKINSIFFVIVLIVSIPKLISLLNNISLDTLKSLYILLLPITLYLLSFIISKTVYMKMDDINISLAIGNFYVRNTIHQKNIEKVVFVKDFKLCILLQFFNPGSSALALHLKNGKVRYIRFQHLSEEDQEKAIEIFREKGLLKE